MYNRLSTEAFGKPVMRAQAVNPAMQSPADLAASRMRGGLDSSAAFGPQFTGGKEEYQALMQQQELRDKIDKDKKLDAYRQAQLGIAAGHLKARQDEASRTAKVAELTGRNQAFEGMSKQAKEIYSDTTGYLKSSQGFLNDMREAQEANSGEGDFAKWQAARDELTKMNAVHAGRKLTVPLVDAPPFFPPAKQKLIDELTSAQDAAASARKPWWGESPEARKLREATAAAATGPGNTMSTPFEARPRYAPANTPLSAELVNRAQQNPEQVTPEEAQQLGLRPSAPAATPMPAAAPGATTKPFRDDKTGRLVNFRLNPQTKKWEPAQ